MVNFDRLYTDKIRDLSHLRLNDNSVFVYQQGLEERSHSADDKKWQVINHGVVFREVAIQDKENDIGIEKGSGVRFALRSREAIQDLICANEHRNVYIDSSGMGIRLLAPILKFSLESAEENHTKVYVIYSEPEKYDVKKFSAEARFYNLAESIEGLIPLPTYETIRSNSGKTILMPMLGFEGGRFAHVLANQEVGELLVIPLIGVGGFRPEYPFVTYEGNRKPLTDEKSVWEHTRYAMAGSVVDALHEIMRTMRMNSGAKYIKLAPLGTKPHTIAALLFAYMNPWMTEIIYDNPNRGKSRTFGVGQVSITDVTSLIHDLRNA